MENSRPQSFVFLFFWGLCSFTVKPQHFNIDPRHFTRHFTFDPRQNSIPIKMMPFAEISSASIN